MIFNWYENSKQIHKTKLLTRNDGQDLKGQHSQEIAYVRYLLSLGLTKPEMFANFVSIKNGSAAIFSHSPEQQLTLFNSRLSKAKKLGPLTNEDNHVIIYQKEIDYLNKLVAPLWVRQYWLGLLIWYKTIKKRYTVVIKDTKWYTWIMSKCKNNYSYRKKVETLAEWNRRNKFPVRINTFDYDNKRGGYKYKASAVSVTLKWCKTEGDVLEDNVLLENFTDLFKYLRPAAFTCKECGQLYDIDKMNPNDLHMCPICQKAHFRARKARNKRDERKISVKLKDVAVRTDNLS